MLLIGEVDVVRTAMIEAGIVEFDYSDADARETLDFIDQIGACCGKNVAFAFLLLCSVLI